MSQTQVYDRQAIGIVGEWVNNSLVSEMVFPVKGTGTTAAVKASGTVTITTGQNAEAGDVVSVGGVTYTFVASDPAANEVEVGTDGAASAANLAAAISGLATATSSGLVVTIKASVAGVAGNDITLTATGDNLTASGAKLTGGADYIASNNATIGNAFTFVSGTDNQCVMGGTGVFAGIAANPKNVAISNNLTATLQVPDGTTLAMAKSGYILVKLANDCAVGDAVFYTNATGALSAGTASTGQTQIKGAQIIMGGTAGSTVKMGFIPQV